MKPNTKYSAKFKWFTTTSLVAALASGTALAADERGTSTNETVWYNPTTWFGNDDKDRGEGINWRFWEDEASWSEEYGQPPRTTEATESLGYTWNVATNRWEREDDPTPATDTPARYTARGTPRPEFNTDQPDGPAREETLSGRIVAFRQMSLQAEGDEIRDFIITKIELENGENVVVSLGEKEDLNDLNLEGGNEVEITGILGQVGDAPIFITTSLEVNNQRVDVNRAIAQSQAQLRDGAGQVALTEATPPPSAEAVAEQTDRYEQEGYAATRARAETAEEQQAAAEAETTGTIEISGRLESVESAEIEGTDEALVLASLALQGGHNFLLDLGMDATVESIGLESGSQVRIVGTTREVEEQTVLQAKQIWIDGNETRELSYRR